MMDNLEKRITQFFFHLGEQDIKDISETEPQLGYRTFPSSDSKNIKANSKIDF